MLQKLKQLQLKKNRIILQSDHRRQILVTHCNLIHLPRVRPGAARALFHKYKLHLALAASALAGTALVLRQRAEPSPPASKKSSWKKALLGILLRQAAQKKLPPLLCLLANRLLARRGL